MPPRRTVLIIEVQLFSYTDREHLRWGSMEKMEVDEAVVDLSIG